MDSIGSTLNLLAVVQISSAISTYVFVEYSNLTTIQTESMEFDRIQTEAGFKRLRNDWNRLTQSPLHRWEWHYAWWKEMAPQSEPAILVFREEDRVFGLAPMCIDRINGDRRLRFTGSGNVCTDYAGMVTTEDRIDDCYRLTADWLLDQKNEQGGIQVVELDGVTESIETELFAATLQKSYWRYSKPLESTWVLPLAGDWNGFVQTRSKSLRRKIRNAEKRMQDPEIQFCSTLADHSLFQAGSPDCQVIRMDEAFETLVQLHQSRFRGKGESGVFADPCFTNFLRAAIDELHQQGMAEIVICRVGNVPIGAHFYLHDPEGPQMYQSGICDQHQKLEPGHLMFTFAIRRAVHMGCSAFDFLRGDEPYKKFWSAQPVAHQNVRLVSNQLTSTLKHQCIRGARQVKSILKDSFVGRWTGTNRS